MALGSGTCPSQHAWSSLPDRMRARRVSGLPIHAGGEGYGAWCVLGQPGRQGHRRVAGVLRSPRVTAFGGDEVVPAHRWRAAGRHRGRTG